MKQCKTCKHWKEPKPVDIIPGFYQHAICDKLLNSDIPMLVPLIDEYYAVGVEIMTFMDFGCVLHEEVDLL